MEKKRTTVNIAGQEFRISSTNDGEYLQELASRINRRVRAAQAQFPDQSVSRCALLAMLEMEDELASLRAERDRVDKSLSELRRIRSAGEPSAAPVKRPFERRKPVGV